MMDIEALIASIYRRRPIWDIRHALHANGIVTANYWKEISLELNVDEYTLREKWKCLCYQFSVELGKTVSAGAQETVGRSKWPFFKSLLFLKGIVKAKSDIDNLSEDYQMSDEHEYTKREIEYTLNEIENRLNEIEYKMKEMKLTLQDMLKSPTITEYEKKELKKYESLNFATFDEEDMMGEIESTLEDTLESPIIIEQPPPLFANDSKSSRMEHGNG